MPFSPLWPMDALGLAAPRIRNTGRFNITQEAQDKMGEEIGDGHARLNLSVDQETGNTSLSGHSFTILYQDILTKRGAIFSKL